MKKNLNVIQINGTRGLIIAGGIVCCLAAGFIWFPGWIAMHLWNFINNYNENMPTIGIIQGILLWGILATAYFTFRKNRMVVCMRSSEGLSEDELRTIFADITKRSSNETLIQSMIKAKEAELRIKNLSESSIPKIEKADEENELKMK